VRQVAPVDLSFPVIRPLRSYPRNGIAIAEAKSCCSDLDASRSPHSATASGELGRTDSGFLPHKPQAR
jgi:hypothetical protein